MFEIPQKHIVKNYAYVCECVWSVWEGGAFSTVYAGGGVVAWFFNFFQNRVVVFFNGGFL